ncbi:alpha-L-fucosidase [Vallitalea okinawensis]|uniref:alpha-L-fucosidase n=1 Tax=Vallitalea okinawensis TaxID=2078660 RepID=UPI000CFD6A5A|nr:alpha-L-fucosidase [Vallitalea okinawensis]
MSVLCKADYEVKIAETRDERMQWWREARFGMFVHYGLYSELGRNEWVMALENYDVEQYKKLANSFCPREEAPREWAKLAKEAGMKYMVLTTRHHEGFSLWDSKVNPYNSVNYGPKRDIVKEFVEACREYDLKIGFYSSLMDWQHPDGGRCAYDSEARKRFNDYIKELNRELMTQYGKIDILWYDVPRPMESHEGWNSLELNQMVRELQPHIIINNRSKLDEDFGTPEEHITAEDRDWEACMTFNGISWGYIDSDQVLPYSYTPQQIIRMIRKVTASGGNLLLNVGPKPDGSLPKEVIEPLNKVGKWLIENGEAVYGKKDKGNDRVVNVSGVCQAICENNKCYVLNIIWPKDQRLVLAGIMDAQLKTVRLLKDSSPIDFKQVGHRIILDLPVKNPDENVGIPVFELEFDQQPNYARCSYYPPLHGGKIYKP